MSFSSRLHKFAFGGFLATLLLAPLIVSGQENKAEQRAQTTQPQKAEQHTTPPLPVTVTGPVTVTIEREKTVEPNWKKPSCDAPQNHDEADLCQQIRMSEANEQSVRLNGYQSGIAVLGALLVVITIIYARWAAIAARDAANHAEASAKAANESAGYDREANQIARDHAELGLRANVLIDSVVVVPGTSIFTARIVIKNYGQTPAYEARMWVGIDTDYFPLQKTLEAPAEDFRMAVSILGPGQMTQMDIPLRRHPTEEEWSDFKKGDGAIYVFGGIRYRDAFKQPRTTKYRMFSSGEKMAIDQFAPYHTGNEAD
jgi:hypothetical protein